MPRTRPSKNSSWARTSKYRHSTIVRYIRSRVSRSMSGAAVADRRLLASLGQYALATNSSSDGKRVMTCGPSAVTTTSSSMRAAETPSLAGQ